MEKQKVTLQDIMAHDAKEVYKAAKSFVGGLTFPVRPFANIEIFNDWKSSYKGLRCFGMIASSMTATYYIASKVQSDDTAQAVLAVAAIGAAADGVRAYIKSAKQRAYEINRNGQ